MKIYIVNEKQYCCDGMYHDDIDDNGNDLIKIIRLLLGLLLICQAQPKCLQIVRRQCCLL